MNGPRDTDETSFLHELLMLPEQASTLAPEVDRLHYIIITTTMVAATLIFTAALVFLIRYRRRSESYRPPRVTTTIGWEVLFIGLPLSVFVAFFFMGYHDFIRMSTPPPEAMDVYVTGKQWMWKFTYPEGPNSVGVLRVPTGRPVRLLLTSRDVIHSFFVPAFRMKQDAVPGVYTQTWFQARKPGRYRVFCAEYCGLNHSEMWGEVVALEPADFEEWMQRQRQGLVERRDAWPSEREQVSRPALLALEEDAERPQGEIMYASRGGLLEQGREVAVREGCLKCHTVDGTAHIGPTWLDLYLRREKLASGEVVVADEAYLTESMMHPGRKVVAGFQPVMPSYLGQLEAAEVAGLLEYIKSLRSGRLETEETEGPVYGPTPGGR
ncbi:MAG TPA: cytochrome c oxidase subunit II [Myxococcaceae bacterium]|nr:cytochrome c oxidase subunit II [Myxococcaceae bacterium]